MCEAMTTVLELGGIGLLVAAAAIGVGLALALAVAGVAAIVLAWRAHA